jgi:hypothetical protein
MFEAIYCTCGSYYRPEKNGIILQIVNEHGTCLGFTRGDRYKCNCGNYIFRGVAKDWFLLASYDDFDTEYGKVRETDGIAGTIKV